MGIAAAFFGELISIVAYVLLAAGVFKLFQIATILGEIKEVLGQRSRPDIAPLPSASGAVGAYPVTDDASEYAAKLLRAVSSESHSTTDVPYSESR